MTKEEVQTQIVEIVTPFVKEPSALAALSEETRILDDLRVNSARLVDIVLEFEDRFDIEVEDDAADQVKTIGDATDLVFAKLH